MSAEPIERLTAAIAASGLSARQFATIVMGRDERTIRRWLAGEPMPAQAREWLDTLERVTLTSRAVGIRLRR